MTQEQRSLPPGKILPTLPVVRVLHFSFCLISSTYSFLFVSFLAPSHGSDLLIIIGWIKEWNSQYNTFYYVDNNSKPPRSTWIHPDDEERAKVPAPPGGPPQAYQPSPPVQSAPVQYQSQPQPQQLPPQQVQQVQQPQVIYIEQPAAAAPVVRDFMISEHLKFFGTNVTLLEQQQQSQRRSAAPLIGAAVLGAGVGRRRERRWG
jgi:hypothetical protein